MESAAQAGRRRLYPSLRDPGYLTLRSRRLIFASWALQFQGKRLRVLDIGARYQPYRPLFDGSIDRYLAVDLKKTELINVVADGETLPFLPASFDLAIATQVFEYFRDPAGAARQIHTVLRPGGVLLASFAACAPRFVEGERWRFTSTGLRSLLEPFSIVEIVPELSSVGGSVRLMNQALDTFSRYDTARRIYRLIGCPVLNLFGLGLESLKLTTNDQFTTNYSVKAVKAA
jgi:SAM-dependent methyltransferase